MFQGKLYVLLWHYQIALGATPTSQPSQAVGLPLWENGNIMLLPRAPLMP